MYAFEENNIYAEELIGKLTPQNSRELFPKYEMYWKIRTILYNAYNKEEWERMARENPIDLGNGKLPSKKEQTTDISKEGKPMANDEDVSVVDLDLHEFDICETPEDIIEKWGYNHKKIEKADNDKPITGRQMRYLQYLTSRRPALHQELERMHQYVMKNENLTIFDSTCKQAGFYISILSGDRGISQEFFKKLCIKKAWKIMMESPDKIQDIERLFDELFFHVSRIKPISSKMQLKEEEEYERS
jgi:hypothetical protein